ncbi:major facilitator superfamily transporter [Apiospora sp. TS-2023a]
MVELTVTSFLLVQGLTSVFWGAFADAIGRRPIYLIALVLYLTANVALSYSPNFTVLMLFRGVQSGGSASTLILGSGVIQDISPPSERGTFTSFYLSIRNFSIAVGPVLGGALAQNLGFRSIFIFLSIGTAVLLVAVTLYLPETLRAIAGNGSLRLSGVYQPWMRRFKEPGYTRDPGPKAANRLTSRTVLAPLMLLFEKDIFSGLLFSGLAYTSWGLLTATTTPMFEKTFRLSETLIGLCFLPNGLGTIVGSVLVGSLMTTDYKAVQASYNAAHDRPRDSELSPSMNLPADFPLERARLRHIPWVTAVFVASLGLYGLAMDAKRLPWKLASRPGWIAVPLLLQFLIAASSNGIITIYQTLISDLCPGQGAGSTAISSLVSRLLNAAGVSFVEPLLEAWGPAYLYLGLAGVGAVYVALAAASWYLGPGWRRQRLAKLGLKEEEDERKEGEKKKEKEKKVEMTKTLVLLSSVVASRGFTTDLEKN